MTTDAAAPLVTTVIPTYRRPALLRRAIKSALAQTMPRIRVAVFDNASDDGTAELVAELARADSRVHYHRHATNIGSIPNISYGFSQVATPFFSLLSDDDVLLPEFYEKALDVLGRHPEAALVAGQVIEMTEEGEVVKVVPHLALPEVSISPPEGLFRLHLTLTGVLLRDWVARTYAPFDPDVELVDLDFYLRLAARDSFVLMSQVVGIFVSHPGSFSHQMDVGETWSAYRKVLQRFHDDAAVPDAVKAAAGERMTRALETAVFRLGLRAVAAGRLDSAEEAHRILGACPRQTARAAVLGSLTALARRSSSARRAWAAAYTSLKSARQARISRRLQRQYSGYSRHLEIPPSAT